MNVPRAGAVAALLWFFLSEFFLRRGVTARRWSAGGDDRGTSKSISVAYAIAVVVLNLPVLQRWPVPAWLTWLGLGLAVLGTALRFWSMHVLGGFYTRTLLVAEGQAVVTRGPYARIRHPGYAGALLVWIGAVLALGFGAAATVIALVMLVVYVRRIVVEERMLTARLGEPYRQYQLGTVRLLPGLW